MFFRKTRDKKEKTDKAENYFRYRDSVTGQMNKEYAFKAFEKIEGVECGALMIHVLNVDNMPYYKAVECIKEAGQMLAQISEDEVARLEEGYFLIFSESGERLNEKMEKFLPRLSDGDIVYASAYAAVNKNEGFGILIKKLKRRMAVAENTAYIKSVRELPRI